jgi:hypothetical protein
MIEPIKIIEKYKKEHEFNAENCRRKQQRMDESRYRMKVEDIEARINYVVSSSKDEHTVIYSVKEHDKEMYGRIADHFIGKGFKAAITGIDGFDGKYLVIEW